MAQYCSVRYKEQEHARDKGVLESKFSRLNHRGILETRKLASIYLPGKEEG